MDLCYKYVQSILMSGEILRNPTELAFEARDSLITLGNITVSFAQVDRLTVYPTGDQENDAEHSFHLALSAVELAATYYPDLDTGLVAQFSLVHDLPEVYALDTPSYRLSAQERQEKEDREKLALVRLLTELPPHTAQLLMRYEEQTEPEARFVRLIDKLLPAVIHAVAADANREVFLQKYDIKSAEELKKQSKIKGEELRVMFPEFDFIHIVRSLTSSVAIHELFAA